jgi:hypothetical protein
VKVFVIKLGTGEYVKNRRMTSHYLDYERTIHKNAADRLHDFDSQLVLKRLATLGEKNATREEMLGE